MQICFRPTHRNIHFFSIVLLLTALLMPLSSKSTDQIIMTKEMFERDTKANCEKPLPPDLEKLNRSVPTRSVDWVSRKIRVFESYDSHIFKGLPPPGSNSKDEIGRLADSKRWIMGLSFYFPSLRGPQHPGIYNDHTKILQNYTLEGYRFKSRFIPEELITISVMHVADWSKLPMPHQFYYWRLHYKPNLNDVQVAKAKKEKVYWTDQAKYNPDGDYGFLNFIDRYAVFDLRDVATPRQNLYFFESVFERNPSPYDLPRFACEQLYCVGHFKMDDEYIVMYTVGYPHMQCWQKVEDSVKRVINLNTRALNK